MQERIVDEKLAYEMLIDDGAASAVKRLGGEATQSSKPGAH